MSFVKPIVGCLAVVALTAGCGSRNLYKNTPRDTPAPLEHTYVYMTRDYILDAGFDPVEFGSPLPTKDTIYVLSETRGVEALERANFRRKWKFMPEGGASSQAFLDGDTLFVGANDGRLYAIDAEFGRVIWSYNTKSPILARPTVAGSRVYVHSSDDVVHCVERSNGKWVWHYKRGVSDATTIRGNSVPVVDGNVVYVGFSDGYFVALKAQDGNLTWERKVHTGTKFQDVDAMPVFDGNHIFIPSYDGDLYALDRQTGTTLWRIDSGGARKVVLDDKILYLPSSLGKVLAVNKDSGRVLWKFELDAGTPTGLVLQGNYLAFGSSQLYFYVIHKGDGTLAYRYNTGMRSGFTATPQALGQELFAFSNYGNLHVFRWNQTSSKR